MSLHAWFANDDVAVEPGSMLVLPLRIQNLDADDEIVAIVPTGPASSWTVVPPREITVPAGEVADVELEVHPPDLPTTNAGPTTVAVRVIPQDERLDLSAETTIDVLPFDRRRIVALQQVQRTRRRATYEFMVENEGNNMASCRLRLVDVTDRVDGDFDPPAVGVPPGETSLVQLRSRVGRQFFRRAPRTIEFDVEAEQQGHQAARETFTLIQPPTVPTSALWRMLGVLALLAAAVAAWFWVVQPEIESAAADEVDRLLAEAASSTTVADTTGGTDPANDDEESADDSADTTDPDDSASSDGTAGADATGEADGTDSAGGAVDSGDSGDTDAADDADDTGDGSAGGGEPDFVRLKVEAALTQTVDSSFTIPEGQIFDLTDIRIENPFNDSGVATLLVNGEEVFLWSLANIRGSQFEPSITQKRLMGGDNVTFSVRCDAISDPFRATCTNAVNVGGLVFENEPG